MTPSVAAPGVTHPSDATLSPTEAIEIFGNVSTPVGTVAIC